MNSRDRQTGACLSYESRDPIAQLPRVNMENPGQGDSRRGRDLARLTLLCVEGTWKKVLEMVRRRVAATAGRDFTGSGLAQVTAELKSWGGGQVRGDANVRCKFSSIVGFAKKSAAILIRSHPGGRPQLPTAFALALIASLGGCRVWYVEHDFRYRLTVEIDTPQGLRTESSVIAVKYIEQPRWAPGRMVLQEAEGEGVPFEFQDGRVIVALLGRPGSDDAADRPNQAFMKIFDQYENTKKGYTPLSVKQQIEIMKSRRRGAELSGWAIPPLIIFSTKTDPTSGRLIDEARLGSESAAGYRMKHATIEITQEPVTHVLRTKLPWLSGNPDTIITLKSVNPDTGARLNLMYRDLIRTYR